MPRVCPTCGASENEKQFVTAFCIDCFAKQRQPLETPKETAFTLCTNCKRIRVSGEWLAARRGESEREFEQRVLKEQILKKTRLARGVELLHASVERRKNFAFLHAVFSLEGKRFEASARVRVEEERRACEDCVKKASGYYEAIIQVRGERQRVARVARRLERVLNAETFFVEAVARKEGVDLLVGSKQAALQTLSRTGLAYSLSLKLVGVREGKRVHRVTACVRV